MSFNTLTFMVFFAVVYGLYLSPMGWRPKKIMLLLACYVFYGWSNPWGPAVVLLSTLVDYACGLSLGRRTVESERKLVLGISIAVNLGPSRSSSILISSLKTSRQCWQPWE